MDENRMQGGFPNVMDAVKHRLFTVTGARKSGRTKKRTHKGH